MAKILILYGTAEGQTRKIATQVRDWVQAKGHIADLVDSADLPDDLDLSVFGAFILAGSLHEGHHQKPLTHFVIAHREDLVRVPSAFLSVSLTAVHDDDPKHHSEAQACIDSFVRQTGWTPTSTTPVAGALKFTQYDWFKRALMKAISKKEGGAIDTTQDHEYTDWPKLQEFIDAFLATL